jgi:hypothetical protein
MPVSAVPRPPDQSKWRVAAAVTPGVRHRRQQTGCQDVLRVARIGERRLLVTLADGAGSAEQGGLGAELATGAALAWLASPRRLPLPDAPPEAMETAVREALAAARAALERAAERHKTPLRQFAATLLIGVVEPEILVAGQIGDGAVVGGAGDGVWRMLTRPASGEYLNETVFVTSDDALEQAQLVTHRGPLRELALFSDGLQMLALDLAKAAPHAPFFRPLFRWLAALRDPAENSDALAAFLRSPKVTERTDDDLSLCLARWTGR